MDLSELELLSNFHLLPSSLASDLLLFQEVNSVSDFKVVIQQNLDAASDRISEFFRLGVSCLVAYTQSNFCGPPVDLKLPEFFDTKLVAENLALSSEPAYALSKGANLLCVAKIILSDFNGKFREKYPTAAWWTMRLCMTWQYLFVDRRAELRNIIYDQIKFFDTFISSTGAVPTDLKAAYAAEKSFAYAFYFDFDNAQKSASDEAFTLTGLSGVQLTGILGRRTKFQAHDVAQLTIIDEGRRGTDMESSPSADGLDSIPLASEFPLDCALNDDTLLDKTSYERAPVQKPFTALQECVLVAFLDLMDRLQTRDVTSDEIKKAYIDRILSHPVTYAGKYVCLIKRCVLEADSRRRVERALAQAEALVKQYENLQPPVERRLPYMFTTHAPPIWEVRKLEAQLLASLGVTGEALRIYIHLKAWDDVVSCYRRLGMMDRAEFVLREQLAERETPHLLCLLGDVTDDPTFYEKAWELSGRRFARARSALGMSYFARKKYADAIECLDVALAILPLDLHGWYSLGFCAMQVKDYEKAARAYRRCATIEPDNFEAWNNLAACYIYLNDKHRAFQILNESIRCNYENWKVWENYVLLAVDTHHYKEAVAAVSRLIDLKDHFDDVQVLAILVKAATETTEEEISPGDNLKKSLLPLFGRLTAKIVNNVTLWRLYTDLCKVDFTATMANADDLEKYVSVLQRAHQTAVRCAGWEKDDVSAQKTAEYALRLAEAQCKLADVLQTTGERSRQLRASARMNLKGVLTAIASVDRKDDAPVREAVEKMRMLLEQIEKSV